MNGRNRWRKQRSHGHQTSSSGTSQLLPYGSFPCSSYSGQPSHWRSICPSYSSARQLHHFLPDSSRRSSEAMTRIGFRILLTKEDCNSLREGTKSRNTTSSLHEALFSTDSTEKGLVGDVLMILQQILRESELIRHNDIMEANISNCLRNVERMSRAPA